MLKLREEKVAVIYEDRKLPGDERRVSVYREYVLERVPNPRVRQ